MKQRFVWNWKFNWIWVNFNFSVTNMLINSANTLAHFLFSFSNLLIIIPRILLVLPASTIDRTFLPVSQWQQWVKDVTQIARVIQRIIFHPTKIFTAQIYPRQWPIKLTGNCSPLHHYYLGSILMSYLRLITFRRSTFFIILPSISGRLCEAGTTSKFLTFPSVEWASRLEMLQFRGCR